MALLEGLGPRRNTGKSKPAPKPTNAEERLRGNWLGTVVGSGGQGSGRAEPAPKQKLQPFERATVNRLTAMPEPEPIVTSHYSGGAAIPNLGGGMTQLTMPSFTTTTDEQEKEQGRSKRVRKSFEMTWDDYQNLDPKQRAAVDFNTQLVAAREKDLNAEYEDTENDSYRIAVQRIFGEEEADDSDIFAPETVELLNQIGYKAPEEGVGSDLDDFLGLRVAIRESDLDDLDLSAALNMPKPAVMPDLPDTVNTVQGQVVEGTQAVKREMAKAGELLQDFNTSMQLRLGQNSPHLGGTDNTVPVPVGFGTSELDKHFQVAFEVLADRNLSGDELNNVMGLVAQDFEEGGMYAGQGENFMRYVRERTKMAGRGGAASVMPDDDGTKYRSPEEFREILGLNTRRGGGNGQG